MYEDLADFAVNELTKKGASYAEARLEVHEGNSFIMKNGIVEVASFGKVQGLGMRFIIDGTLGFFDTNILERSTVNTLIASSMRLTKRSSKICEKTLLSKERAAKKKDVVKQKVKLENVGVDEKINFLSDLDKTIIDSSKHIQSRHLHYEDEIIRKYFVNSEGSKISAEIPIIDLFYLFTIKIGSETIQRDWQYGNSGGFEFTKSWRLGEKLPNEIKALEKNLKDGKKTPKGKIDVVVAPEVTGIIAHESVGHPYEADRILGREAAQAGESFVKEDMIGSSIGSAIATVVDDPTLKNSFGYFLYDDEGVKARRKYLMKKGKINEFLQNRETAAVMGLKSNGSSRAQNYSVEAIVRMSNTFVLPGNWKDDELIADTKSGIYVKNFMEWNIDDVRLNQRYVGNEAYLIENGELTHPLKRPVIEITTPNLWKSIDAISNKIEHHAATCGKGEPMQGIPVWMGGPTMRLKNLMIK